MIPYAALHADAINHGGFTYSTQTHTVPARGFAVSIADCEDVADHLSPQRIEAYARRFAPALSVPGAHLGCWFNETNAHWYLDVSVIKPTLDEALVLARKHRQLAVYDLSAKESIAVP